MARLLHGGALLEWAVAHRERGASVDIGAAHLHRKWAARIHCRDVRYGLGAARVEFND